MVSAVPADAITTHLAPTDEALQDYAAGCSAETISTTERWASVTSLRYYLTIGRAWLLRMLIFVYQRTLIRQLAAILGLVFDDLPAS